MKEFQYSETNAPGLGGVKPISWTGIRHMIVEVGPPFMPVITTIFGP